MGKRKKGKRIPAALHSEISEYASLLRVLRVTDALDITTQLTRLDSGPSRNATLANEEEMGRHESPTSSHVVHGGVALVEEKGHSPALGTSQTSRNTWTRWPLLAEDVHIPEWKFEDEVQSLAKQALLSDLSTSSELPASTSSDLNVPSEDQVEALLPPSSLRVLADVSSSHLEKILSALASYTPVVDKSTHHRRHPLGWESVLNIVSASGLVDGEYVRLNHRCEEETDLEYYISIIRNVRPRLEAIYGSRPGSSDWLSPLSLILYSLSEQGSSDITSDVPELPVMTSLHDLESTNFFDGNKPGNRTCYDELSG